MSSIWCCRCGQLRSAPSGLGLAIGVVGAIGLSESHSGLGAASDVVAAIGLGEFLSQPPREQAGDGVSSRHSFC